MKRYIVSILHAMIMTHDLSHRIKHAIQKDMTYCDCTIQIKTNKFTYTTSPMRDTKERKKFEANLLKYEITPLNLIFLAGFRSLRS